MRCNNDIRSQINNSLYPTTSAGIDFYNKLITDEKNRIKEWREAKIEELQNEVEPLVKTWAKKLKKNYSNYLWEECPSSEKLYQESIKKMFNEKGWNDNFPTVNTKKLQELKKKSQEFRNYADIVLAETYVEVSFIKSLDELTELIEKARTKIRNYYAN